MSPQQWREHVDESNRAWHQAVSDVLSGYPVSLWPAYRANIAAHAAYDRHLSRVRHLASVRARRRRTR